MAKTNDKKRTKGAGSNGSSQPSLEEMLKTHLPNLRTNGKLLIDEPIRMDAKKFATERYSIEFFKLIKAKSPNTPLIIIQEEDQPVTQLGWFDALDTGLWYNILPVPQDILDDLV